KDSIQFRAAENLYHQGEYARAESALTSYLTIYPKSSFSTYAKYLRAESRSLLKNYTAALDGYAEVVESGAGPYYVPSLFKAAVIAHRDQKSYTVALDYYQSYLNLPENPDKELEAQIGALDCAYQLGLAKEVFELANEITSNPRATPQIGRAHV